MLTYGRRLREPKEMSGAIGLVLVGLLTKISPVLSGGLYLVPSLGI